MPNPADILALVSRAAREGIAVAVAFHVLVVAGLVAAKMGWRPRRRDLGLLLTLPVLSVGAVSWIYGNPFNGTVFVLLGIALAVVAARFSSVPVDRPAPSFLAIGLVMTAFGLVYPHFLGPGPAWRYLYGAPIGLAPCPTLSLLIGLTLLASGLGSTAWSIMVAFAGVFYGLFGAFRLGVRIDLALLAGALVLYVSARFAIRKSAEAEIKGNRARGVSVR